MESTKTTEFDAVNPWVTGDPSVDSKEQTRPRAAVDTDSDDARHDDTTTENSTPVEHETGNHVQMFQRPDLDGDEFSDPQEQSSSVAERVVQIALLLVLVALIAAGVAVVIGHI